MTDIFVGDNDHGDTPLPPLSDLLWEEVNKLRQEVVLLNNVINEITTQRDYARREVCWLLAEKTVEPTRLKLQWFAADRGWDCFKEEVACDTLSQEVSQEGGKSKDTFEHKIRLDNSYDNIVNKHHNAFEQLAREKNNNG